MPVSVDVNSNLTDNAKKVLERRYLKKDPKGKVVETPQGLFTRVAENIAQADRIYDKDAVIEKTAGEFYSAMANLEFLPNSPTLMNAGCDLQQLSACFVLPIEDSMASIFETLKQSSLIHKCLVPETLVMTERGLIQLKETRSGDRVLTDEGFLEVDSLHDNGEQMVLEVATKHGYSIKGTAKHRLLVVDDKGNYVWRQIGELKKDDWVILKPGQWRGKEIRFPKFNFKEKKYLNSTCFRPQAVKIPEALTSELAEFIGLYIGDGANHRDGIRFTVGDEDGELVNKIGSISLKIFDKKTSIARGKRKGACEVALLSVKIKKWFKEMQITKLSSRKAAVPKFIFEAEEKEVCAFLRGLFSADGCIRKSGHITLGTSSAVLANQIQTIMLYLGMPTHQRYYPAVDSFQLSICTKGGFINFKEKIGFLNKRKQSRLEAIKSDEIFLRGETMPNQAFKLREWYDTLLTVEKRLIQGRIEGIISGNNRRELSKQSAVAMLEREEVHPEFFQDLIKEDFLFDQVRAVSISGVRRVYDITVPQKHAYIADGFISHNSGGGTGFSFSRLRPKSSQVRSTGGVASGPISFLKVFDAATQAVKQGGMRRGANMGILRVDHPDILEFITCKESDKDITNFNISVAVTDEFMKKVEENKEYDLIDPHTKEVVERLNAKEVFDLIVKMSWKNGEPGIIFLDKMNKFNPTPKIGTYESTNPCGEQILLPFESCNLGSINLSRMVKNGEMNWSKLAKTTRTAVHFLDNVIDMNNFPIESIRKMTRDNRKIGLGVMGFADMLIKLGIPYDSDDAVAMARKSMKFIHDEATATSTDLALKRGTFPNYKDSVFDTSSGPRLRNATLTTIAPTGTLSIIAGCSSGVEPIFALVYYKEVMDKDKLPEVNDEFQRVAKEKDFYSEDLMKKVAQTGSVQEIVDIPHDVKKTFITSHDISPEWHIKIQAAFQEYTDNAVSKTINFPQEAKISDIEDSYKLAYKLGCKGVTIYRDKSREEQVLNVGEAAPDKKDVSREKILPKPRPTVVTGTTTKIGTGCGNLYITINEDGEGHPFEVFMQMGKAGGCAASQLEAIGRLVSLAFRASIDVQVIVDQLRGIRCPSPSWEKGGRIFSCADAIARAIEKRLCDKKEAEESPKENNDNYAGKNTLKLGNVVGVCPDCGGALRHVEGCQVCRACGYSKCG